MNKINNDKKLEKGNIIFLMTFLILSLGFAGLLIYNAVGIIRIYVCTWGLAVIAVGGFLGFLFGLPNKDNTASSQRIVNTNIFEISNSLTKIIIGAGLVQLKEIPSFVFQIANKIAIGVNDNSDIEKVKIFINGLLIYCFLLGIVGGYIITQIFLVSALKNVIPTSGTLKME